MTVEQLKRMQDYLLNDDSYSWNRQKVRSCIDNRKHNPEHISIEILELANSYSWSRRKLYVILHEIIVEIKRDNSIPKNLYDVLTNMLDALDGNVASEAIIRLQKDPSDNNSLRNFVRSLQWVDTDYFDYSRAN